jgi:hypothetical protein
VADLEAPTVARRAMMCEAPAPAVRNHQRDAGEVGEGRVEQLATCGRVVRLRWRDVHCDRKTSTSTSRLRFDSRCTRPRPTHPRHATCGTAATPTPTVGTNRAASSTATPSWPAARPLSPSAGATTGATTRCTSAGRTEDAPGPHRRGPREVHTQSLTCPALGATAVASGTVAGKRLRPHDGLQGGCDAV